jgi:tRNA-2-methylthio-N6-dimethylallyladenosine synthase
MPWLHLPVQSGNDRVLDAMNRKHTRAHYLSIIDRLKAAQPELALSSDFIVGFPGETDAEFRDTVSLVEEVGFASAFSFKYSPRPGTPAANAPHQVPEPVKAERLAILQAAIEKGRLAFDTSCIGRRFEVLVEKPGRYPGQMVGRSPWLQPVQLDLAPDTIGTLVPVRATRLGTYSLYAEAEDHAPPHAPSPAAIAAAAG